MNGVNEITPSDTPAAVSAGSESLPSQPNPTSRPTAYLLKDSLLAEPFPVLTSANAWWIDKVKLNSFVQGLKTHYFVKDACIFAGISIDQYKHFKAVHPEFVPLVPIFQNAMRYQAHQNVGLGLTANKRVVDDNGQVAQVPDLDTRLPMTRWYLERTERERFGKDTKPAVELVARDTFQDDEGNTMVSERIARLFDTDNNAENQS
jgi:hypothetical protein